MEDQFVSPEEIFTRHTEGIRDVLDDDGLKYGSVRGQPFGEGEGETQKDYIKCMDSLSYPQKLFLGDKATWAYKKHQGAGAGETSSQWFVRGKGVIPGQVGDDETMAGKWKMAGPYVVTHHIISLCYPISMAINKLEAFKMFPPSLQLTDAESELAGEGAELPRSKDIKKLLFLY